MKNSILLSKSDDFAQKVYAITKDFPKDEMFGLTSQVRRAALSVPANIVEGYARQSKGDFLRFLKIAYASLKEARYLLYFATLQKYLTVKNHQQLLNASDELGKIIWSLTHKK